MNKHVKFAIIDDLKKIYYRLDRAELHNRTEYAAELRGKLEAYGRMLYLIGYYYYVVRFHYNDKDLISDTEIEIKKLGE